MIHKKEGSLEWLEFNIFADQKELIHRVYLKHGGHSQQHYESLNFSYQVGDNPEHVDMNMNKISGHLNHIPLVRGKLSHGKRVVSIDNKSLNPEGNYDAITTQTPNIGLLITHADCQATILYDPVNQAIANVHCGWRGLVQNIYKEVVEEMQRKYGSNPKELLAGISPSLGPQHAEFVHYKSEFPREFWDYQVSPNHFNLWAIATKQLQDCGLVPEKIECANWCTYSDANNCFSFRRKQTTGRHGTIVLLKT